jgi:sodium pump decarboxylase gamma subunit
LIQAAYLTVIGMGTAFGLLLVLISSIFITKVIANRLDRAPDPKEKEENIRQATAAAVAVSILKAKASR